MTIRLIWPLKNFCVLVLKCWSGHIMRQVLNWWQLFYYPWLTLPDHDWSWRRGRRRRGRKWPRGRRRRRPKFWPFFWTWNWALEKLVKIFSKIPFWPLTKTFQIFMQIPALAENVFWKVARELLESSENLTRMNSFSFALPVKKVSSYFLLIS